MQCLFCGKESIVLIQILVNLGVIYHMKGGLQSKFFTLPQMVRMWDGLSLQLRKKSTGMSQKKVQKGFYFFCCCEKRNCLHLPKETLLDLP